VTNYISLAPRALWEALRGYDERYYGGISAEDSDFVRRARKLPGFAQVVSEGVSLHQYHSGKTCYYSPPPSVITKERWAEGVAINHAIYHAWDGASRNPQKWPWGQLGTGEVITNHDEFPGRYTLQRLRSPGAALSFPDGSFDFIHIDAGHSYKDVEADLEAWWPKLNAGGCFSGDDFADTDNPTEGRYGVVRAVTEFADRMGLTLLVHGAGGQDRPTQLAFAARQGELAGQYLRGARDARFHNPVWYITKERP
jgi:hypothetical protein